MFILLALPADSILFFLLFFLFVSMESMYVRRSSSNTGIRTETVSFAPRSLSSWHNTRVPGQQYNQWLTVNLVKVYRTIIDYIDYNCIDLSRVHPSILHRSPRNHLTQKTKSDKLCRLFFIYLLSDLDK